MTAISISDANLEAVKDLSRELALQTKKNISLRELEDRICEYILTRKKDFVKTMFSSENNSNSEANKSKASKKEKTK